MAVQQEIWRDYIAEQLFRNNDFLNYVKKVDNSRIMNGKTVHIPQAGALPTVSVDVNSFPYAITQRTDTESSYDLSVFRTAPDLLADAEAAELSYDKMQSVWKSHTDAISQAVGDRFFYWMLYNGGSAWTPGTNAVTVPAGNADGTNNSPTYTTNRNKVTIAELISAAYIMTKQGVPMNDRYCVLPAVMYYEIMAELGATTVANAQMSSVYNNSTGMLTEVAGFKLIQRPTTWYTTATGTYTAVTPAQFASPADTYQHAALCFQSEFVEFALGDVKIFEEKDSASYFGSIYSGEIRAGGRPVYTSNYGVVPILQTTP